MHLLRLDTQRIVNPREFGYPKDSFTASPECALEWDEGRGVVLVMGTRPGAKKKHLAAIVPIDNVAFMWPADE